MSGMTRKATTINTKGTTTPVSGGTYDGKYFVGETRTLDKAKNGTVTERVYWYVVTAYPKASLVPNETSFHNEVNVILHPLDGLDADSNAKAADSCTFKTFKWNHPDGIIDFYKYSDHSKNSWTAVYKALSAQG